MRKLPNLEYLNRLPVDREALEQETNENFENDDLTRQNEE